ncbi:MAG: response regulator [Verrucomicrobiae bacterium]|nr:response regulator [Verrucomicrobiae bacterium]
MNLSTNSRPEPPRPTILIVDDQAEVLAALQLTLRLRGYHVLGARSGPEALQLLQSQPGLIDVLVTDFAMPEMDGRQLIQRVKEIVPSLPAIAISGNASPSDIESLLALGVVAFLQKPFSVEALSGAIERALELRRQAGVPASSPASP